jgi:hypothetical protein
VGSQYFSTQGLTEPSDFMKHLLKARAEVKRLLLTELSLAVNQSPSPIASQFLCNYDPYYLT